MLEREMQVQQSASATHDFDINKSNETLMHINMEQVPTNAFVSADLSNQNAAVAVANQFVAQCEDLDIEHEPLEDQIAPGKEPFRNVLALDTIPNLDADTGMPDIFASNWPR